LKINVFRPRWIWRQFPFSTETQSVKLIRDGLIQRHRVGSG